MCVGELLPAAEKLFLNTYDAVKTDIGIKLKCENTLLERKLNLKYISI